MTDQNISDVTSETHEHLRVALFTDLLVYDYSGSPPEHPDEREVHDLRQQADWLIERGWTRATSDEDRP